MIEIKECVRKLRSCWTGLELGQQAAIIVSAVLVAVCAAFLREAGSEWRQALPERIALGKPPNLTHFIRTGLWWAAAVNLPLSLLLLATATRWGKKVAPRSPDGARWKAAPVPRFFWLLTLLVMAAGAFFRSERLSLSFDAEELYGLGRYALGSFETDERGTPAFDRASLSDTFFGNRAANNHVLFSLTARASSSAFAGLSGQSSTQLSEPAYRLPAFIASVTSIGAFAWLLRLSGFWRAGLAAAALAALHPWHIWFGSTGNGVAMAGLFLAFQLGFLLLALRSSRVAPWVGFGVCQVGMLYSFFWSGAIAALLDVGLLIYLFSHHRPLWWRGAATIILGCMAIGALMGPSVPQIYRHLAEHQIGEAINLGWWKSVWAHLTAGVAWEGTGFSSPLIRTVEMFRVTEPLTFWFVAIILPGLVIAGIVRWMTAPALPGIRLVGGSLLAAVPVWHLLAAWYNATLPPHFAAVLLPVVILFAAVGIEVVGDAAGRLARGRTGLRISAATACLLVLCFGWASETQRSILRKHPKEDLKQVSRRIHGDNDPGTVSNLETVRLNFWSSVSYYDPWMLNRPFDHQIRESISQAQASGRPLYVTFGHRSRAVTDIEPVRAAVALVENPQLFEKVAEFHGLHEDQFTHHLFRLRTNEQASE
jgi:hypothetical protein